MQSITEAARRSSDSSLSRVAHWRQVRKCSTVESAETTVRELRAQGIDAVLSMIDGLCVLARRDQSLRSMVTA